MLLSVLTFGNNDFFPTFPNKISFLYWPTSKQVASFSVSSSDVGACKYKHIQIQMQDNTNTRKYKYKYKHIQIQILKYKYKPIQIQIQIQKCAIFSAVQRSALAGQSSARKWIPDKAGWAANEKKKRPAELQMMMLLHPFLVVPIIGRFPCCIFSYL